MVAGIPLGVAAARWGGSPADAPVSVLSSLGVTHAELLARPDPGVDLRDQFALAAVHGLDALSRGAPEFPAPCSAARAGAWSRRGRGSGWTGAQRTATRCCNRSSCARWRERTKTLAILWKHGPAQYQCHATHRAWPVFNRMLAATVVVEAVFAIPGLGTLVVQAALAEDFPVVQGVVLVMVLLVIVTNLIVDAFCSLFDPRVVRTMSTAGLGEMSPATNSWVVSAPSWATNGRWSAWHGCSASPRSACSRR